jgi:hypothetical protein
MRRVPRGSHPRGFCSSIFPIIEVCAFRAPQALGFVCLASTSTAQPLVRKMSHMQRSGAVRLQAPGFLSVD